MQGKTRLVLFISFCWVIAWSVLYFIVDPYGSSKIDGYLVIGILPAVLLLFGWWVKLGFAEKK